MQMTIHLREIANGVLVSHNGSPRSRPFDGQGETYYPSWETAMSDLPGYAAGAREEMQDLSAAVRHALKSNALGVGQAATRSPPSPTEPAVRLLPEEEAALSQAPASAYVETNTFNEDVGSAIYSDEAIEPVRPIHVAPAQVEDDDEDSATYIGSGYAI